MTSEIQRFMEFQAKEQTMAIIHSYNPGVDIEQLPIPKEAPSFNFNRFPQEIQDEIWKIAIYSVEPRVVAIRDNLCIRTADGGVMPSGQLASYTPAPGVLQACSRSRQLALETKRWKLCFGNMKGSLGCIFFDFSADILYFGMIFFNMEDFKDGCNVADRSALLKIAFHTDEQCEYGYFEGGEALANKLHGDFPSVKEVIFANENVDFDWEADRIRGMQPDDLDDPKKSIVKFRKALRKHDADVAEAAKEVYALNDWNCPEFKIMDYEKSYPGVTAWSLTETQLRRQEMELNHEMGLLEGVSEQQLEFELNRELYGRVGEEFPGEFDGSDLYGDVSAIAPGPF